MKAITYNRYGSSEVLELSEVDKPAPGASDVLIRVHAAGVDAGVLHLMTGTPYLGRMAFGLRKPKNPIPGMDVAGTVEAVGKNVTRFRPGDEVYAEVRAGSFAEYTYVQERFVGLKPANLTFEQAAAVPVSANTALQAIRDKGKTRPGQRVLVIGASGGVGTFAVQIAKSLGAEVTGVCSGRKADLVRSIGADHVIDYTREDFAKNGQRYDVIFDLAGDRYLTDLRRALAPKGILVLSSGEGGRWLGPIGRSVRALMLSPFVSQRFVWFVALRSQKDLIALKELIESGKVTPVIDRIYPLGEARKAVRYVEEGKARGKVVIAVDLR